MYLYKSKEKWPGIDYDINSIEVIVRYYNIYILYFANKDKWKFTQVTQLSQLSNFLLHVQSSYYYKIIACDKYWNKYDAFKHSSIIPIIWCAFLVIIQFLFI